MTMAALIGIIVITIVMFLKNILVAKLSVDRFSFTFD